MIGATIAIITNSDKAVVAYVGQNGKFKVQCSSKAIKNIETVNNKVLIAILTHVFETLGKT